MASPSFEIIVEAQKTLKKEMLLNNQFYSALPLKVSASLVTVMRFNFDVVLSTLKYLGIISRVYVDLDQYTDDVNLGGQS